ncbi:helix-turn-helix domain-containing protein [Ruminiclostridium cellobioparum]|uniref:helix-turn-helix domain-containing protein n=1 Tax=Ruminiclostridium cellobioparum TaxID=29355 RepID=UPI000483BB9C|nr:helix-turn-helix transcriptional regulator [Ruminiclostridium cellobioparum]
MSDIAKIVGDRIRILRNEKGLTLEELGDRAGINATHLGRLERGEKSATVDSLEKIVNALEISFEHLFKYIQPSTENTDNTALSILINKLSTLSVHDQKLLLPLIDDLFKLMKHKT